MYGANVKSAHDGPPPDGHGGGPFTKACIDWRCLGTERDTFGQWRRNCGGRPECVAAAAPRNGLSGHNGAPPPPSETAQAHIFRSRSRLGSPLGGRGPSPVATPHSERLLCAVWGGPRRPHLLITPPRSVGHTLPHGAHPCDCPYPIVASVPPFHQSCPPLPTIVPLPHTTRRTFSFPPPSTPPPSRRILCTCV